MKSFYRVIGLMSGTSLDGLDIAQCTFELTKHGWNYAIERATTYPYSPEWKKKLTDAHNLSGIELMLLHNEFGRLLGTCVNQFLNNETDGIDFIASHGHTVFHQPEIGLTLQIGNGAAIAAIMGITTIADFRSLDVALGGQGAPLVPIGDELLFSEFDFCLNLGGFANISFKNDADRIAFDVCPVNILINHIVKERNLSYDPEGSIARNGNISSDLLYDLNNLEFYQMAGPKSLGREWLWKKVIPVISRNDLPLEDKLRTLYQHIIIKTSEIIQKKPQSTVLITGGGAHNQFLIELFKEIPGATIVVPSDDIVDFKEALIFSFLGVLRFRNEPNCLRSVTGAKINNIGGVIIQIKI
jgi:anhydro-N-acetylmuramic acid kinase